MHNRLSVIIREYDLTSGKLADILSIQPSAVSHLLSGRNKPGFDLLSRILVKFPELNPRWLILGEEPMYLLSSDKRHNFPTAEIAINPMKLFPEENNALSMTSSIVPENDKNPLLSSTDQSFHASDSNSPKVDKVMIFYSDGTFEIFKNKESHKE